ncbi:MAG: hypothetical protein IKQ01_00835 [Bacteroidales bacterium]|jgi:hypothetical protein|nr:hypothetical protein [Bacteroidales bacterium]MBR4351595.1 hypothetical protein [Bacteroidales bacterium]
MVHQFRATIPESKVFYRVYEIKGEMTLFRFNSFITDNLAFSPDQMVIFEGFDEKGKLCSEYGLFDMGDGAMDTVTFDKVLERGETELHFVFDLRNDRYIKLVYEGQVPYLPMRAYPALVEEKGQNPDQFHVRFEEEPAVPKLHPSRVADNFPSLDDELDDLDDEEEDDDAEDRIFDDGEGEELYDESEGKE